MIRKLLKLVYALLFFVTPLIVVPVTSELFEFNKIIVIYTVAATVFLLWSIESLRAGKIVFRRTFLDIPIGLFLLSQIVSTIFSIDIHTSVFGYYGRFNGGLLSIIAYILLYFGFVSHFSFSDVKFFLKVSVLSSLIVMLLGLPGKFGHDTLCLVFTQKFDNTCWTNQFRPAERMFSTLGQPNWLGAYLAVHFFIGLYFVFSSTVGRQIKGLTWRAYIKQDLLAQILPMVYVVLTFVCILFTRSRSAYGGVAAGLVIAGIYILIVVRKWVAIRKPVILLIILGIVALIIAKTGIGPIDTLLRPPVSKQQVSQSTTTVPVPMEFGGVTESFDIRKIVWKGAIELAKKYPVLGTGPETFAYAYYFVRPAEHNLTSEWDFLYNKAHNEYLNYLATTGVVGLLAYLALIGVVSFYVLRKLLTFYKKDSLISQEALLLITLYSGYVTILVTNFTGFSTTTIQVLFYLLPAMMILIGEKKSMIVENVPLNGKRKLGIVFAIGLFLTAIFGLVRYVSADILYAESDVYVRSQDYQSAAQLLSTAIQLKDEHVYEDKLATILAQLAYLAAYQKESDVAANLTDLSVYYMDHSLRSSPKNVVYLKNRAKNYYFLYQISFNPEYLRKGIDALNESALLYPTDPKIPYSQALFYSLLEDETEDEKKRMLLQQMSLDAINKSIQLKKNYIDAYLLKGQLLRKKGDIKKALVTLQQVLDTIDPNNAEVKSQIEELKSQ